MLKKVIMTLKLGLELNYKNNLELKIPDVCGKLNTSDFNSKVSE